MPNSNTFFTTSSKEETKIQRGNAAFSFPSLPEQIRSKPRCGAKQNSFLLGPGGWPSAESGNRNSGRKICVGGSPTGSQTQAEGQACCAVTPSRVSRVISGWRGSTREVRARVVSGPRRARRQGGRSGLWRLNLNKVSVPIQGKGGGEIDGLHVRLDQGGKHLQENESRFLSASR